MKAALHAIPNHVLLVIGCLERLLAYCLVRSKRRSVKTMEIAAQRAESGQLHAASELLLSLIRAKGSVSPYAQAALAHLHLRRGHLGHAVSMLAFLTARNSGVGRALRCSSKHSLAYVFAVGGDLERAERHWSVTASLRGPMSPLECLLLCKRGRFGELVNSRPADFWFRGLLLLLSSLLPSTGMESVLLPYCAASRAPKIRVNRRPLRAA